MIKIPIISSDLKQDEVTLRAIKTFEYLDKVVDEVFNRIDARISKNLKRIDDIDTRLEKASTKIESLKGSKKAIRILSPGKYPISLPPKFTPTFHNFELDRKEIEFDYNLQINPFDNVEVKNYSNKLQFFHLKRNRQVILDKPNLIYNTKSINSLITFVNNENIILNDSSPRNRIKDEAPASIISDTTDFSRFSTLLKSKQDDGNFHYFPNIHQAPEVELPIDLPDLPGIAGDISFSISDQELIAPSLAKMNIINELPNVADLIEAETIKKSVETSQKLPEVAQTQSAEKVNVPMPPPVPVNIPPPPPPIPQNFIPTPPPVSAAPKVSIEPSASQPSDMRSSLMAAIRNAGGAKKLRSVAAAEEQVPMAKKKVSAAPAGDLMSDLHAKLALRRRGIAGTKEAKKEKVSLMEKVSSLIPPPAESDDESSTEGDTDWD